MEQCFLVVVDVAFQAESPGELEGGRGGLWRVGFAPGPQGGDERGDIDLEPFDGPVGAHVLMLIDGGLTGVRDPWQGDHVEAEYLIDEPLVRRFDQRADLGVPP